jgi:hypothetical protein
MMNRGVMERQMFARGGAVQRFQAGGPAMPMQDNPTVAAAMPTMGMADTAQLQQMPMEGVMGMAQQAGIDPAQLEQMLGGMAGQFQNLDQAEDFEQVMNAMRGDQAPIAARREELANLVGPEDANATPESVLALVQPVMMMAAVDQGIGGLAAEEMSTPIEGPMAEGIMSMAMPQGAPPMPPSPPMPQGAPPMPGGEGPAPVNFRFGGPVVAMNEGGEPGNRLAELYGQQREVYRSLLNPADQQADMDRQRNMTQAQMLFDVANTALAFAGPGSRSGMSPAERLAEAAQQTQFFDRISQRAGGLETARQEQAKEGRALDLAALQSASGLQAAEFEASLRPASPEADVKGVPMSIYNQLTKEEQLQLLFGTETSRPTVLSEGAIAIDARGNILADNTKTETKTFTLSPGQRVVGADGTIIAQHDGEDDKTFVLSEGQRVVDRNGGIVADFPAQPDRYTLSPGEQVVDENGTVIVTNESESNLSIHNVDGTLVGVDPSTGETRVLRQSDKSELMIFNGQIVSVNPRTNVATPILGEGEIAPPEYLIIRDSRNGLTTTIDVSTATGRAAIDAANAANREAGTTVFTVRTMPSDSTPQAKAFQVGSDTVLSYDGGRTYVSPDGQIRSMPTDGVVPLSDTIAYEVMRSERIRAGAGNQLAEFDERLGLTMRGGDRDNPTSISSADAGLVRDALQAARRGTGPWSAIGAFVDNVAGGMIPNQAIRTYFQNNQENRQFLRGVTILGRSALVVNPRFPVAEMERVGALFPDPDVFFRNPESEALKLIELKSLVMSQYRANLAALNRGISDAATLQAVQANNFEIERLLGLLQTVPDGTNQGGASTDALESLRSTISGR